MIESLFLAVTRISTLAGDLGLTNATGFFYENGNRLFLVTNRHVAIDEASGHRPDRFDIRLHTDPENVSATATHSIPLYVGGERVWREVWDTAGVVDIIAIELDRAGLPPTLVLNAFDESHLLANLDEIEAGERVIIVGFPLGFHDTFHHLPVARQAVIASSFGMRFQGQGYFLTDARMHRGTSGAPVVARRMHAGSGRGRLPWLLLGVHAARLDVIDRDVEQDERLDLNCAWYADALPRLTDEAVASTAKLA